MLAELSGRVSYSPSPEREAVKNPGQAPVQGRPARTLTPGLSARHQYGAELRRWRCHRGLTQQGLAALVWHSAEIEAKVEKGERWPSLDFTCRCENVLGIGGALLALWPQVEQMRLAHDGRRRPRPGSP